MAGVLKRVLFGLAFISLLGISMAWGDIVDLKARKLVARFRQVGGFAAVAEHCKLPQASQLKPKMLDYALALGATDDQLLDFSMSFDRQHIKKQGDIKDQRCSAESRKAMQAQTRRLLDRLDKLKAYYDPLHCADCKWDTLGTAPDCVRRCGTYKGIYPQF